MAKPITLQMPPRDPRAELVAKLQQAPITHAAAILDWYELLQQLHDSGLMSAMRGAAGQGGKIAESLAGSANTPEAIRAMRNFAVLAKVAGAIDPEIFRGILNSVPSSLSDANARQIKTPSLWRLLRSFTTLESRRALGVAAGLLNAVGRALQPHPKGTD